MAGLQFKLPEAVKGMHASQHVLIKTDEEGKVHLVVWGKRREDAKQKCEHGGPKEADTPTFCI